MPNNPKAMGRVQSDFEVKFTDETYQALKAFEDEIERRYDAKTFATVLQSALTSGAKSIVPDVRAQVPGQKYGTGRLRGAIRARASRFMTPASVVGIGLGARRSDRKGAWYAWIYTKGAQPHSIEARRHRFLHFGSKVVSRVEHPGFTGRPFVPAAVERASPKMLANTAKITNKFLVDDAFQQRILNIRARQTGE